MVAINLNILPRHKIADMAPAAPAFVWMRGSAPRHVLYIYSGRQTGGALCQHKKNAFAVATGHLWMPIQTAGPRKLLQKIDKRGPKRNMPARSRIRNKANHYIIINANAFWHINSIRSSHNKFICVEYRYRWREKWTDVPYIIETTNRFSWCELPLKWSDSYLWN